MQPYIFPYIGYFQLIAAVDRFVFYDDVNFIKKGWINRNNLLVNASSSTFTIPLKKVSQNKLINEIQVDIDDKWLKQFYSTVYFNYKKAPFYDKVIELIEKIINERNKTAFVSDLAMQSVINVSEYIGLSTKFEVSSELYSETKGMEKAERLKKICKLNHSDTYINPPGGIELYDKSDFLNSGINLQFIKSQNVTYKQLDGIFVPWLSIIDVLMFNDVDAVKMMLKEYELI
jgi:hypothetical protein